ETNAGEFDFWARRAVASTKAANTQMGQSIDTTVLSVEKFKEAMLSVGKGIGVLDPKDIASSWYFYQSALGGVIKTEQDLAQTQHNMNTLLRASVITNTDTTETIRGITSAMAEFGMGAEQLDYA